MNFNKSFKQKILIRNIIILLGSTLSVMAGASIAPALSEMKLHFSSIPNSGILVKILISVPSLFIAIFSPVAGYLLDKYGRKKILSYSILLFAISGTSGFYLDNLYLIIAGRIVLGIAVAGTMTGFIALIGDIFQGNELDRFIGIQASVMSFGGVVYLFLSGLLADIHWNYPFLIYFLAFIILILFQLSINSYQLEHDEKTHKDIESVKFRFDSKLIIVMILGFISMAIYLMIPIQLPFFMNSLQSVSNSLIGIYMSIWIFASGFSSLFFKKLKILISYKHLFVIGFALWSIGYFIMFVSKGLEFIIPGLIFAGIGNGLVFPNLKVLLLNVTSTDFRGKAAGFLTMSLYLGQFFSPLIMEPIIKKFGISYIFFVFGIILIVLSVLFLKRKGISTLKVISK